MEVKKSTLSNAWRTEVKFWCVAGIRKESSLKINKKIHALALARPRVTAFWVLLNKISS